MPRKHVPISKRQHDAINGTVAQITTIQDSLKVAVNAIVLGTDEVIPQYGIVGAECSKEGVYSLVLELPDIAPAPAADPVLDQAG